MKKSIYILIPLLFSFLCISAQSYKIAVLPFKSSSNQGITQSIPDMIMTNLGNSKKYYFQPGNQLLTEMNSYEVIELDVNKSIDHSIHESVAYLVGKLNTGENLNLSELLYPSNTGAINLESDTTYQITFSGNLRFRAIVLGAGFTNDHNNDFPVTIDVEFYGTDTFTLRPNETNIIQVDIARPPQLISYTRPITKMRWQLQVTNK